MRIIDSEGAPAIPLTAISLKCSAFTKAVDAMHASYEGTVNGNGTEMGGTWSRLGQSRPLGLKRATPQAAVKPAPPSDIDGTWMGTLNAEDVPVHTLFKIANTSAGLIAEWQSPDQSPTWVFATAIKRNGPSRSR